ncbi:hypothetical protein Holit_02899 [Hollandina sp. SP2]
MFTYFLYFSILAFVASSSYIAEHGNTTILRLNGRLICFLVMLIPAILRYGIGTDYLNYISWFNNKHYEEIGWYVLISLCYIFNLSSWWFIAITSAITYYLICFLLPRKHFFFILTFYILYFCYFNSYNIIRQLLASSLLLCGISFYYNYKTVKAYLFFFIAVLFHFSSVIIFLIILLSKIQINKYIRILFLFIGIGVILKVNLWELFFQILSLFSGRYARYLLLVDPSTRSVRGIGVMINMLVSVMVLYNSKKVEDQVNGNFVLNVNYLYILLCLLVFKLPTGRLNSTLIFIELFSIGILLDSNRKYRTVYLYSFLFLEFVLFIRMLSMSLQGTASAGIYPYSSIFDK